MRFLVVYDGESLETATVQALSKDAALLTVVTTYLGAQEPAPPLRHCPECGALFEVAHGKQVYCSRPCKNRVAVRHWRQKPANRQAARHQARAAYKARKAALVGNGQEG